MSGALMLRRTALVLALYVFLAVDASGTATANGAVVDQSSVWRIDPAHSRVAFTVTKWGFFEVEGRFFDFGGTLRFDPASPAESSIDWTVRVASVRTGSTNRDEALQESEYFDAARFPEMRFRSERVRVLGERRFEVTGSLTIRGATRPLSAPAEWLGSIEVPGEGAFEAFRTAFAVDRYDFGVAGDTVFGLVISNDVRVTLALAAQPADGTP